MKPTPLTDEQIEAVVDKHTTDDYGYDIWCNGKGVARAIEAARDAQWVEMLAGQEPVAWMDRDGDVYKELPTPNWHPPHTPLYAAPHQNTDDTALLKQALDALRYFDDYVQPLTDKFGGPKVDGPASTSWHVHHAIAALEARLK